MTSPGFVNLYRKISQFHENNQLIAWVQACRVTHWLTPPRRRNILFIGAIFAGVVGLCSRHAPWREYRNAATWLVPAIAFPIFLGLVYLLYLAAVHFKHLPKFVRARPQISLHLCFWFLLLVIWFGPDPSATSIAVISLIAISFPYLIWRAGYMLMAGQRGKAAGTLFRDHLLYIWPVWDGTNTPPGKGHDYLSAAEARTAEAYARSVLAGIKLLLLVALWKIVMFVINAGVYSDPKNALTAALGGYSLGIPRLRQIVSGEVTAPLIVTWVSLYMELIWETLSLAAKGHTWVGTIRLFGFNIFRNTYKPLLANTVVEFWNRYYYYFKELMVEFFFFPTYLRYFRGRPILRIVAAVFAAAFLGNMYYHLLQAKNPLIQGDFVGLWQLLGARLIYCFVLATGIAVSMLRQQKQRGKSKPEVTPRASFYRVLRIGMVWTFFSVINFWNVHADVSIPERSRLFLALFGL